MDRAGIDGVEWHLKQIKMQRLARPTNKQKVADFVMVVEKAFQYFDFKDFLAELYPLEENAKFGSAFARTLCDLPLQMNKFDALSSHDIGSAVETHIAYLQRARHLASQRQHHYEDAESDTARTPSPPKDPVSTLLDRLKEEDFYAFSTPIFRAVFLSRNRVYDMDLCPKKEIQKIKSSPGYRREKGANAAIVAKMYEEACNKYRNLVLGLSKEVKASKERGMSDEKRKREQHEVKAPKERRMSDEKRKREQHAEEEEEDEGGKGEKGANAVTVLKKAPKERRTSDEKRKREQHAEEEVGGKGEKGVNTAIFVKKYEEGANAGIALKKYEEACNKYRSIVLGVSTEVKDPKERRMSDKKQKLVERHARRVQKCLRH